MRGKFITFEGPEGSGKSTHIGLLAEWLRSQGKRVVCTREPGGTGLGEIIRNLLQYDSAGDPPVPMAEVMLFLASRAQHVERLIQPALKRGAWVICDRFADSTFAYQGYGRGLCLDMLKTANNLATGGVRPDLTILLDVDVETSLRRITERSHNNNGVVDRIECEERAFHERLRRGFLVLSEEDPRRFLVIDSRRERGVVSAEIRARIGEYLMDALGRVCEVRDVE